MGTMDPVSSAELLLVDGPRQCDLYSGPVQCNTLPDSRRASPSYLHFQQALVGVPTAPPIFQPPSAGSVSVALELLETALSVPVIYHAGNGEVFFTSAPASRGASFPDPPRPKISLKSRRASGLGTYGKELQISLHELPGESGSETDQQDLGQKEAYDRRRHTQAPLAWQRCGEKGCEAQRFWLGIGCTWWLGIPLGRDQAEHASASARLDSRGERSEERGLARSWGGRTQQGHPGESPGTPTLRGRRDGYPLLMQKVPRSERHPKPWVKRLN
ncbi:hypothetical protein CYMTET_24935 [Cymbomonas tetramitiformis]|uniref:Uncharacterized protein n=1 Tax=Cymbomonas tetramitiformis TaxID=36881 RepID=A0AAE0FVK8_9CHLO|nr:hypothetical protein CYMTET_24935 [Cymbomonas tetramitiformis]